MSEKTDRPIRAFTDNKGRAWTVEVTTDSLRDVRTALQVNLMDLVDGDLVSQFIRDPVLLCDVIYVICKPQADVHDISDVDFGRAMAGDAIDHATHALLESIVDFCPSPTLRAKWKRAVDMTLQVRERAIDVAGEKLDALDIETLVQTMQSGSGNTSTSLPASSE